MNKKIIKDTLILVCITLIAGLALGLVYDITKEPIAKQKQITKENACKAVFAEADSFDTEHVVDVSKASEVIGDEYASCNIDEAIPALDKDGNCIGYAMTVTCSEGYGGDITVMIGITKDGTVNGIDFLALNETAGLGMEAKNPDFAGQFANKQVDSFVVTKNEAAQDSDIEAISAATITSNAVTKAVNAGLEYFRSLEGGAE